VSVATLTALARRSLNIEILRDPAKGKCISSIPRRVEFIFKCRGHFEQLSDADAKKLFWLDVFGYPTAASLLLTLVIPNVHPGTNLLAMIVYPHHDRFREKDIPTLGSKLSQFDMDPSTLFVHCQNVRNTMLEPFPKFNYEEIVLIVQPGAHGEPAHFTIPSLKSARLFITSEVTQCVKEGTFILPAFNALMTTLPIENTPTSLRVGSISQGTAFGAAGSKVFQGKGSGGKGGRGGNTKTSVKTYGFSGGAGGGGGIKTGGIGSGADVGGGSKTSSGSGGGGGGGSGGASASTSRGRAPDKAATASRLSILAPGDSTGVFCYARSLVVICYARFVALLGTKMENLPVCAGLINKYFKDTVKHNAFVFDNGTVRVPLTLDPNFAWKATSNKFLNHNVRRDIYAALHALRHCCGGKGRDLTVNGTEYKETHPTWEYLSADEFAVLYTPTHVKTKFNLGTYVIRRVTDTEFSA
jgi:hypothetical protein